jgi:uncharacterized protein
MSDPDARGRFVWFELMTTDPAAAIDFYTRAIGWGTQVWEGGSSPYTMWTAGERMLGGVWPLAPEAIAGGARPHWLAYVETPDVDATLARACQLGAKLLREPMDIPAIGRFAVLSDPQGATFAPFTSAGTPNGHDGAPSELEISWHELATTDPKAAFAFYQELFGWDAMAAMDMGPSGIYQMFGRKGVTQGGVYEKPAQMPGPPAWLHYVAVHDTHATAARVAELGGKLLNGPMEVPEGPWIAQLLDPQGAAFAIYTPKPA